MNISDEDLINIFPLLFCGLSHIFAALAMWYMFHVCYIYFFHKVICTMFVAHLVSCSYICHRNEKTQTFECHKKKAAPTNETTNQPTPQTSLLHLAITASENENSFSVSQRSKKSEDPLLQRQCQELHDFLSMLWLRRNIKVLNQGIIYWCIMMYTLYNIDVGSFWS